MADNDRSINQIADSLRSVRVYLEPVQSPVGTPAHVTGSDEVLGVPVFLPPDLPPVDAPPQWYRVLGVDNNIDSNSMVFIVAKQSLPLNNDPKCGLSNVGYVELPTRAQISFVEFTWGDDLFSKLTPDFSNPISGGVEINNAHAGAGQYCCDLHIYAHAKIAGKKYGFDKTYKNVCVDVDTCVTVVDGGIASFNVNLSLCYDTRDHPKQLFAEVIASIGPFSKTYDAVLNVQ